MKKSSRKMRKPLLVICCMMVLIAVSVSATLAYFTDSDSVANTFTVGKVYISLDEKDTDDSTQGKDRDQANKYHLIPGLQYAKDPTVHVEAGSESCWLFVKVENGIKDIEATTLPIETQMTTFGWKKLDGVENVYYQAHTKASTVKDYVVFQSFEIKGDDVTNAMIAKYAQKEIKITAYAVQLPGFDKAEKTELENAKAAWEAGQAQGWIVYN